MKIPHIYYIVPAIAVAMVWGGCSDELDPGLANTGDAICFDVTDDTGAGSKSRSGEALPVLTPQGIIVMEDSAGTADPMYLYCYEESGFRGADTARFEQSAANSRALGTALDVNNLEGPSSSWGRNTSISMTAYHHNTPTWPTDCPANFMIDEPLTKSGTTWHSRVATRFWPADGHMTFVAFAPGNWDSGDILRVVNPLTEDVHGPLKIEYTTPQNCWEHIDMIYAVSDADCKTRKVVPMRFKHAMTAVRFEATDKMVAGSIKYIRIKNVYTKGTFVIDPSGTAYVDADQEAYASSWPDEYKQIESGKYVHRGGHWVNGGQEDITTYTETFMMIPQTLPDDAVIEISFADRISSPTGTNPRTFTAAIGGREWRQGTTVTYRLSATGIDVQSTMTVSTPDSISYRGGTASFDIKSTALISNVQADGTIDSREIETKWVAEFIDDNGNVIAAPATHPLTSWISKITLSGKGSQTIEYTGSLTPENFWIETKPHIDHMRSLTARVGTEVAPFDLSTHGGYGRADAPVTTQTTANCYIINQGGTYKLPLVYGNAIKNGAANPSAYHTDNTGAYVLQNFKNHLGNGITNPYIYNNTGCTPAGATLVWMDQSDIIDPASIKLCDSNHYLQFSTCPNSDIREANAIVAVTDASGNIMWSWHIWFTDYVPGRPAKMLQSYDPSLVEPPDSWVQGRDKYTYDHYKSAHNNKDHQHTLMGVTLGWCSDYVCEYVKHRARLRVRQIIDDMPELELPPVTIELWQGWGKIHRDAHATFYQWGRKDPMRPAAGTKYGTGLYKDKELFYSDVDKYEWKAHAGPVDLNRPIMYPQHFVSVPGDDWCNHQYDNLWDAGVVDNSSILNGYTYNSTADKMEYRGCKTVYDPSPVGYMVGDPYTFAFTTYEANSVEEPNFDTRLNAIPPSIDAFRGYLDRLGWTFFCIRRMDIKSYSAWLADNTKPYPFYNSATRANGVMFFPGLNIRGGDGSLTYYNNARGYSWCSTPQFISVETTPGNFETKPSNWGSSFGFKFDTDDSTDEHLKKGNASVMPTVQNSRGGGLNIRPVKEICDPQPTTFYQP